MSIRLPLYRSPAIMAILFLLLILGGAWTYRSGYVDALRGGFSQNAGDLDSAIQHFKAGYEKNPNAFMVAHDIACCYALSGENEECFHWLKIALQSSYGHFAKEHAKKDADFRSVRQTPQFQALIFDVPQSASNQAQVTAVP